MALDKCTICGTATNNKCGKCKAAAYCSADCQKNDFPLHKLLCSQYQAFIATRPTPTTADMRPGDVASVTYKAAILFPMDSDLPKLIWLKVHVRSEYVSDGEDEEFPEYHHWEYLGYATSDYMEYGKPMEHTRNGQVLKIYMAETAFGVYPLTQCLLKLNDGYGTREHGSIAAAPWAGNLVLVNFTKSTVDHPTEPMHYDPEDKEVHNDVTLTDLRYAFDYLARSNYIFESDKPNPYYIRKPGRWFKAVKICCAAEMKLDGKKNFTEIAISRYHPMFTKSNTISSIAKHMGFPMHVQRTAPNPDWLVRMRKLPSEQQFTPFQNGYAVCLMADADIDSKHWGFADVIGEFWGMGNDGTVLVARKDLKDLTVHQVEALAFFIQDVILEEMGAASEADEDEEESQIPTEKTRVKFIKEHFQSNKFAKFFENFKEKKIAAGDATWADATVPPKGSIPDKIQETEEERHDSMLRMMGML